LPALAELQTSASARNADPIAVRGTSEIELLEFLASRIVQARHVEQPRIRIPVGGALWDSASAEPVLELDLLAALNRLQMSGGTGRDRQSALGSRLACSYACSRSKRSLAFYVFPVTADSPFSCFTKFGVRDLRCFLKRAAQCCGR
jgi:hypothetical protein